MSEKALRFAATLLAIIGLLALFGVTCGKARAEECFECLTRAKDWRENKSAGDIIYCQPEGKGWFGKAADRKVYSVIRVCGEPAEVQALMMPSIEPDGTISLKQRFRGFVVDGKVVLGDKKTSQVVTVAEAKAIIDASIKEAEK